MGDADNSPSGTVTFLFSDIEGSTQLWESAPDSMRAALERHDALLHQAIAAHGGYVFATGGDGFAVAFSRAGDAIEAAADIQRTLCDEPWPPDAVIRVRIGVHTGEATERDGDYFGATVNRAARLMALAHGSQAICSRATAALAPQGETLRNLGDHRLKDLTAAEQVFQIGDGAFPPLRSVDVVPTNLPTLRTELIGRADAVAAFADLALREQLVTLTGVGGVGKTRLALGVAASIASEFADGCYFVELSPVAHGDDVVKAVTSTIGAPLGSVDALARYLSDRRILIVLDNCEHLLDASADLVDAILVTAPDIHIVVTSREPLGIDGEHVRRVQSLDLPTDGELAAAASSAAVRLFAERAAAVAEGFALDAQTIPPVVEICRQLDGIPLAIELAAARVRAMAPAEIARRLDERFRLLAGGSRRSQERHRTLSAAVAWSHDLLSEPEKVTFRRLAVFPASFDLAAAEGVAGGAGIDAVDCALRLVDRSLLTYEPLTDRYRLLETLRQYGADRLAEADETQTVRERHARHYLDLAERFAPLTHDHRYVTAHPILSAELENLRATADWCAEHERWHELLAMTNGLYYFFADSASGDAASWFALVIDSARGLDAPTMIDTLGHLAWLTVAMRGDAVAAIALADRSDSLAAEERAPMSPWSPISRAMAEFHSGDQRGDAARHAALGLELAQAAGDVDAEINARFTLGSALANTDVQRGLDILLDAFDQAAATGLQSRIVAAIVTYAHLAAFRGDDADFDGMRRLMEQAPQDRLDTVQSIWLDVMHGQMLVRAGDPGALALFVRAIRFADRDQILHAQATALRLLALMVSEAGRPADAATLLGYYAVALDAYRSQWRPGWVDERLDAALDGYADRARYEAVGAQLNRGEVLALVDRLGRELGE